LDEKGETKSETGEGKPDLQATSKSSAKITKKTAVVGAAIGIGSAAIVAALLYANRGGSGGGKG
jgi:hypothetical protein